jgi:hypothetical protein
MIQEQDKKLEKYSKDIYKVLIQDEVLLRYLHYIPTSRVDNPLDPSKDNILDKDVDSLWGIIDDVIVPAPKISDLVDTQKSRLLVYAGYGRGTNSNYLFSNQEYEIDIFVHADTQTMDFRMEKIHDRVNELLFNQHITGMGKLLFKGRQPINAIKDYFGYKMIFTFSSENY